MSPELSTEQRPSPCCRGAQWAHGVRAWWRLAPSWFIMGVPDARMTNARLNEWTERQAVPKVAIAELDQPGGHGVDLPGARAYSRRSYIARQRLLKE